MPEGTDQQTSANAAAEAQPQATAQQQAQPAGEGAGEQRVPLAELLRERKARQELEARLKQIQQAQMSDAEKLQARLKELEPLEAEVQIFRQRAERQRDELLKGLPKERRERLQATLETLTLAQQIEILEAAVPEPAPARSADVPRGSPAQPKRLPTLEQIQNDPSLLDGLSKEEIAALAGQAGLKPGGGRIW